MTSGLDREKLVFDLSIGLDVHPLRKRVGAKSNYVVLRGRPRPRPPAAFAPYQDEYSKELRNCRLVPHLRHVPVDSGPLGDSILQWQLPPSIWQGVGGSSMISSSSIFALGALRVVVFFVVMVFLPWFPTAFASLIWTRYPSRFRLSRRDNSVGAGMARGGSEGAVKAKM